ncbi:hypothetical protein [Neobacillus jeddahensis]|uniref:hypothetical protein n=1 Tax=Neobacillus jeddahensis TaxID=1461580 RepID=UPI000590C1B6|nr:hypothetical protein [Neobacillus jeddahensis]
MIFEVISKYHEQSILDKHHRFKSWEHCNHFFRSNYKHLNDDKIFDHACLQLAFYLASWGMLRGGAFLLQKDYRIHEYFINDIVRNPNYYHYFHNEIHYELSRESIKGIGKLIKDTSDTYVENITQINGENTKITVTDTLASKILLGVFGNVPAYDRYLKEALRLHGISQQFNESSLLELVDFYNQNLDEFEKCHRMFSEDGINYTPMKLVDMYFWQVGYLMDTVDQGRNEIMKINQFAIEVGRNKARNKIYGSIKGHRTIKHLGLTDMIRDYIIGKLNQAKEDGLKTIDLKSGDIHKILNLENRMPPVCNAMVSLGVFKYDIIHDTPSGASSTKVIRYYL